jgi:hypothetical protein
MFDHPCGEREIKSIAVFPEIESVRDLEHWLHRKYVGKEACGLYDPRVFINAQDTVPMGGQQNRQSSGTGTHLEDAGARRNCFPNTIKQRGVVSPPAKSES